MDFTDEREPIIKKGDSNQNVNDRIADVYVYKRRWWITTVFSFMCLTQATIWDTWGPIAESSELVFGWTNGLVAQIMNMSSIIFAVVVLPISMFLDIKGLRISVLLSSFLLLISGVIRCITMEPTLFTPLAYISAGLQGVGGAISFAGPAMFSAVWFPLKERATATAVVSFFNYFGVTIAFIIGPQLVPNPLYKGSDTLSISSNQTPYMPSALVNYTYNGESNTTAQTVLNMNAMRSGIQNLMYLHASFAGLVFVLVLVYFPNKPPTPPSMTASLPRTNYGEGLKKIIGNANLLIIVIAGSLPRALIGSWIAVFDVVIKSIGVSQIDAGWIGFWHMFTGSIAGILFAKFSNFLNSRRKALIISTTVAAVLFNIWVVLLCDKIIPFNIAQLYVSCIVLGILVNGTVPLFYEISAETAYPVGEGVAGGFYTLVFCIFEIAYFGILSIQDIGVSWMTWACVGSLIVSLPLMIIFKERNERYAIDIDAKLKN